jgi:hypothetical protein
VPIAAIDHYHALLAEPGVAAETAQQLREAIQRRQLYLGERPITNILRPRFLTPQQYELLRFRTQHIVKAVRLVHDHAITNRDFRHQLGLTDWEEELLTIDPGFAHPSPIARFDGFFVREGELKFVELNTQSPAGAGFADALIELFLNLPVVQRFQRRHRLRTLPCLPVIRNSLLTCFRVWCGSPHAIPRVAIVDWASVATRAEFEIIAEDFRRAGCRVRVCTPDDLELHGRTLTACGEVVDLVYRRVLAMDLLKRTGADHVVFRAARARAACIVNPFPCRITGKKATFAMLSDERYAGLFNPTLRAVCHEHIPWTRILEERTTTFRHRSIDLIPFVLANREELVLKPNDNYGGQDVRLGWKLTASEWEAAVVAAMKSRCIVQERVELPTARFPIENNGELVLESRWLDTCPFVGVDDLVVSSITRLSTEPVVNVAAGGALVPTMIVEQEPETA